MQQHAREEEKSERPKPRITKQTIIAGLSVIIALAWMVSFFVRIFSPSQLLNPSLDSAMLGVVSYWFGAKAIGNGNGGSK